MLSKFIVFALAVAATTLASSDYSLTVRANASGEDTGCMTPDGALAMVKMISWGTDDSFGATLPHLDTTDACVPDHVATLLYNKMVSIEVSPNIPAQDIDFAKEPNAGSLLVKRVRDCPQIKDDAINSVKSKYSCSSQLNVGSCNACANAATATFALTCVACAAKANQESLPCCVAAAAVFTTYYLHNCVHVF